jgi:hypothetical protein
MRNLDHLSVNMNIISSSISLEIKQIKISSGQTMGLLIKQVKELKDQTDSNSLVLQACTESTEKNDQK